MTDIKLCFERFCGPLERFHLQIFFDNYFSSSKIAVDGRNLDKFAKNSDPISQHSYYITPFVKSQQFRIAPCKYMFLMTGTWCICFSANAAVMLLSLLFCIVNTQFSVVGANKHFMHERATRASECIPLLLVYMNANVFALKCIIRIIRAQLIVRSMSLLYKPATRRGDGEGGYLIFSICRNNFA